MKKTLCKMKKTLCKAALTLVAVIAMILLLVVVCKAVPAFAEEILSTVIFCVIYTGAMGFYLLAVKLLLMEKYGDLPDNYFVTCFVIVFALCAPIIAVYFALSYGDDIAQNIASAIIAVFR